MGTMDMMITFLYIAAGIVAVGFAFYYWSNYHVSKVQLMTLCREMSIMLDAGLPLIKVLKILSERVSHPRLRAIVGEIRTSVENGNTVAAAMANYPKVFDEMTIGIVKVGETGGILDESLRRLSVHLERSIRLRGKIITASIYPFLVVIVIGAVLTVLLVVVFPILLEPIKSNPNFGELPVLTRIVDTVGTYMIEHWFRILVLAGLAGVGLAFFRRTSPGKMIEDYLRLKAPLVGSYLGTRVVAAQVSTTFATLVHSGVPIISCLRIVSQTQPNILVSRSFRKTADEVEQGGSLVAPLEESGIYPPLMMDMLAVGDESGTLDTVLDKISEAFTEEVDLAIEVFTKVLETLLIIALGGIVLCVALAAYLPYFKMIATGI